MISNLELKYTTHDEDGMPSGIVQHQIYTEDYLPDVLYAFKSFLQGAGFNYVDNVYVIKSDGVEVGEE